RPLAGPRALARPRNTVIPSQQSESVLIPTAERGSSDAGAGRPRQVRLREVAWRARTAASGERNRLAGADGLLRGGDDLHGAQTDLARRVHGLPGADRIEEGLQQQTVEVAAVGKPLAGPAHVLGEGVDLELAAGAEGLEAQAAPGGGIGRLRPGAVDRGDEAGVVGEGDQAPGLGALPRPVGVEDLVGDRM